MEHETLGLLSGHEKFHHYCFARDVNVITDNKPLVRILKEDMETSQRLQCILL